MGYALFIYVEFLIGSPVTRKEMNADLRLRRVACSLGYSSYFFALLQSFCVSSGHLGAEQQSFCWELGLKSLRV